MGGKRSFELVINWETLDLDIALLEAAGCPRSPQSRCDVEKRLSYLETCIEHGVVPDAEGQRWKPGIGEAKDWKPRHGRYGYVFAGVPVPEKMLRHMAGLADAVERCRKTLVDDNDGDAAKQIDCIDKLVSEICRVALDDRIRAPQALRAKRGRATIADRTARDRARILEYVAEYEKRFGPGSPTEVARKMLHDHCPEKAYDKRVVEKIRGRIRRARAAAK